MWIGAPRELRGDRRTIFRKDFVCAGDGAASTAVQIFCENPYKLYINGRLYLCGPSPWSKVRRAPDRVAADLLPGAKNVLTLIVDSDQSGRDDDSGAVWLRLGEIVSDETWLVARFNPWTSPKQRLSVQVSGESFNCTSEPQGAFAGDIDPRDWLAATRVPLREAPREDVAELPPPAIEQADDRLSVVAWGNPVAGGPIGGPLIRGAIRRRVDDSAIELAPDGENLFVTFDFGRRIDGYFKFCLESAGAGAVDIAYSLTGPPDLVGPAGVAPEQDYVTLKEGVCVYRRFSWMPFRFVTMTFRRLAAPAVLHFLTAAQLKYPARHSGGFACSDERINRQWSAALDASASRLNALLLPGADLASISAPEVESAAYAYGDIRPYYYALALAAESGARPGWLAAARSYALFTGDTRLIDQFAPGGDQEAMDGAGAGPEPLWAPDRPDAAIVLGAREEAAPGVREIVRDLLGVSPASPGFSQVRVAPRPGAMTWAAGVVLAGADDVGCAWSNAPDRFTLCVAAPAGMLLQATLPAAKGDLLLANGERITDDAIVKRTETEAQLCVMPGSGYRFEVVRKGG